MSVVNIFSIFSNTSVKTPILSMVLDLWDTLYNTWQIISDSLQERGRLSLT
jgi:hypothetical protein